MKYVITNADDFGYRENVNKGIIKAHTEGALSSTTVLINSLSNEGLKLAKSTPSLGFGLHLNITSGEPLTDTWKSKYGSFTRPMRNEPEQFNREIWIPFFQRFDTDLVYDEYKAQVGRFIELFGFEPTHLDSHHYSSSFDTVFPAFINVAKEFKLPVRRQVMFDFMGNQHPMGNIDFIEDKNRILANTGIRSTDYFSLLYFNRYTNYKEVIANELKKIDDEQSIELSWHPGFGEDWREKDLNILTDSELTNLFQNMGCKLITFSDL